MVFCYIGIGSNIGDRQHYIDSAVKKIKMMAHTKVRRLSGIIETLPEGGPAQRPYLNAVIQLETGLDPYELLKELQAIELHLGRVRTVVNGPRTIDLDILTYGDVCMREDALCIPHPRILERQFVIGPLNEIAPQEIDRIKKLNILSKPKKKNARHTKRKTNAKTRARTKARK